MTAKPVMSIATCKAALDLISATYTTTSTLKIYTGTQPATTLTATSGTLLATLTFSATAFSASTNVTGNGLATATANSISPETNAPASGTAGYFRCFDGGGTTVVTQGNVGTATADLILNTTTITAGDTISISSFKMTLPCGDGVS